MCPECQNVYIGVRFGQCKVEEEEEEGGRTFLLIVESKNIEQFLTDLVIKSDVWPQILQKLLVHHKMHFYSLFIFSFSFSIGLSCAF